MKSPLCVRVKNKNGWTLLDVAIARGKLEMARFLWEMGGRPNLEIYFRNGKNTPVHEAAYFGKTAILKWVFTEKILSFDVLKIKDLWKRTPLDVAIENGRLEMVQFLWEMGGQPNLEQYSDRRWIPINHTTQYRIIATLKWVFAKGVLPLYVLNIKDCDKWTPLDHAIIWGNLEMAQFLFEQGGRPNLENYRDGENTPVHKAVRWRNTTTLEWAFTKNVLPLSVLNVKEQWKRTPLDIAICFERWEIAVFLRRLSSVCTIFMAMHCAKRDHHCVLRCLPDELLDMVVDKVAARLRIKVEW